MGCRAFVDEVPGVSYGHRRVRRSFRKALNLGKLTLILTVLNRDYNGGGTVFPTQDCPKF